MNEIVEAVGFGLVATSAIAFGAVGFTLQFTVSRIFNVAYGGVMAIAAYTAYAATNVLGSNMWLVLVVGALSGALASALIYQFIYAPFLRRGASVFTVIMASLALWVIILNSLVAIVGPSFHSLDLSSQTPIHIGDITWIPRQVEMMGLAIACMLLLGLMLRFTGLGKAIRGVAADPDLARSCGINASRTILIAWAISGAFCGLSGVALAIDTAVFTPSVLGGDFLLVVIAAAIVGGIGRPYGAMAAALVVAIGTELTAALWSPELKNVAAFGMLVIVLLLSSGGGLRDSRRLQTEHATA